MNLLKRAISVLALLTLAACGGGGGSSGTPPFTGGGGTNPGTGTTPTAADIVLVLSAATLANDGSQTALASVTAVDANRNAVVGVPVTISVNNGGIVKPGGTVTGEGGTLSAEIGIGADQTNRTITVTATSGSLVKTASIEVRDPTSTGVGGTSLDVSISSATVTPTSPATALLTLRSASGTPLSGVVVSVSTARGNLARLSTPSVLTSATGTATVTVQAGTDGLSGADELVAVAAVSGVQVSGRVGFSVQGAVPTLSLTSAASTLRSSAGPVRLTATLRNAAGSPVANQVVAFASESGNVVFSSSSALTNASGVAITDALPRDGSSSSADSLQATTTLAGLDLQANVGVQVVGEVPTLSATLSSSNVTSTVPATLSVTVRDAAGAAVPNTVVAFTSQFGLASFDVSTAATNASGIATVVISPRTSATAGADVAIATATVAGITRSATAALQFSGASASGTPVLQLGLSSTSISSASPATVTARLTDARGTAAAGQVVTFTVVRGLARTNVGTALTDSSGNAVVVLSPTSSSSAGADEVNAAITFAGTRLQATQGFQVQATNVTFTQFSSASDPLSAYGQTPLTVGLTGASVTSPVNVSVTSACVSQGKATISPSSFSTTSGTVTLQYRDNGCGAVQAADQLQVVVDGSATSRALTLRIDAPSAASMAFVQASPETIFLKGSGFTESSIVTFEVRDAAGNPLPGRVVELRLQTGAGGVTMEGRSVESVEPPSASPFVQTSNALGRVSVRVNSGTLPTPVRVHAKLATTTIATVSSNLSVAIGLPSQLNFSLSQGTKNIEGYNIDGTANTYQIIAADRSGNPVPSGTSINFVAEGGQVEAIKQTQVVSGIARTAANFVSAEPRPVDGRVTVTVYALGEESFIDLNGNNAFDAGEPFQDLGNIFRDRNFDGEFSASVDEFLPLAVNNASACAAIGNTLLTLNASIPSVPATCSGTWSGAGQVYVRRATETVLSTSGARPLWASTSGLSDICSKLTMQIGPNPTQTAVFTPVAGDTWYGGRTGSLNFIVGDANPGSLALSLPPRLNPMAAGTTISATTPTTGLTVQVGGGSPVASTTEASLATIAYSFTDVAVSSGVIFVTFRSPSGTGTTVSVPVVAGARPSACP